jgi:type IV pilus assembly protein PilC
MKNQKSADGSSSRRRPLSPSFLSAFCTELAMVIETGIPVSDGLLMLIDDEEDSRTKAFLGELYQSAQGDSFAAAAAKCGGFPQYALNMFIIGEKTGRLDSVLRSLAVYYDRDAKIKESVRSAVTFPLILFGLLLGVMWVLLTQVLPVFESTFAQLGMSFDTSAGMLMRIGSGLENFSAVIFVGLAAIILLVLLTCKVPALRESAKSTFTQLFGNSRLIQSLSAARFSASMAMTLKSGLDIDESLELAQTFAKNKRVYHKIAKCREAVAEGATFNDAVLQTQILSPIHCRMLALSFKTGSTDEIMELIAEKSDEEAAIAIEKLVGRIEPAMAFVMSLLIGLVLLSVMFPLLAAMR